MHIALIGMGPTGLLALAKLFSLALRHPTVSVTIIGIDAQPPAQGVHCSDQPAYLRLNTQARQLSMFEEGDYSLFAEWAFRPNLYEWVAHFHPEAIQAEPGIDVFLPRRYLGLYLQWYYAQLLELTPGNVHFQGCQRRVEAVESASQGRLRLRPWPEADAAFDTVILCTGHGVVQRPNAGANANAYSGLAALKSIGAGQRVAIQGVGLAAMDGVAALTVGRGGVFTPGAHGLEYCPSGREPLISLYSNCGMPYRARPRFDAAAISHRPLLLTAPAIDRMRAQLPQGKLDYDRDLLPLLLTEMQIAYYCAAASQPQVSSEAYAQQYQQTLQGLQHAHAHGRLPEAMAQLAELHGAYPLQEALAYCPPSHLTNDSYPDWFLAQLTTDVVQSAQGCQRSPWKHSLEIWRDLIVALCHAIDYQGLEDTSHQAFHRYQYPLIKRWLAGPPIERQCELIALLRQGLVSILPGYQATDRYDPLTRQHTVTLEQPGPHVATFDHVLKLNTSGAQTLRDLRVLLNPGHPACLPPMPAAAAPFSHDHHPCFTLPAARENIYVFGPALEGFTHFNYYVPSSRPSRITASLERCLGALFSPR